MWKKLIKAAIVGTNRNALPPDVEKIPGMGNTGKDTTNALLGAITHLSYIRKVQKPQKEWEHKMPVALHPEQYTNVHIKALSKILALSSDQLLAEFFQYAKNKKVAVAPEYIPVLLNKCIVDPGWWNAVHAATGERATWLAAQHPEWRLLLYPNEILTIKKEDVKIKHIKILRHNAPDEAREMLLSLWPKMDSRTKGKYIVALSNKLSMQDEDFLENCLGDKSKVVRRHAAAFLAQLPASKLTQRNWERIEPLITYTVRTGRKNKLEIVLPEIENKILQKDGIETSSQWQKGGLGPGILYQMVSISPPQKWQEKLKSTPKEIVSLAERSNRSELLIQALQNATALHSNNEWAEALIQFWLTNHHKKRWEHLDFSKLCPTLPQRVFEDAVHNALKKTTMLHDAGQPLLQLLSVPGYTWPDTITIPCAKLLRKWLIQQNFGWMDPVYTSVFQNMAASCDPKLLKTLRATLNTGGYAPVSVELERLFGVLQLRSSVYG